MLHGRDAEGSALSALLDRARASTSAVLVVRGEAGIGKSALPAEAVARADGSVPGQAILVASVAAAPYPFRRTRTTCARDG